MAAITREGGIVKTSRDQLDADSLQSLLLELLGEVLLDRAPLAKNIDAFFRFDNSAANPFNPSSPPERVRKGWQTTDEMCLFYFSVVPADPATLPALQRAAVESFLRPSDP